jgi:probable HAF family extracellular repeat protein
MWFNRLFRMGKRRSTGAARNRPSVQLQLETLEDRTLPSSYLTTYLGTLGGDFSRADDVNVSGQVAGTSSTAAGWDHAFLWNAGTMIDLGTLGGAQSSSSAINDLGQVVGSADTPDGIGHAFVLNPEDTNGDGSPDRWFRDSNGDGANDLMTALQLPPGATASVALDINNVGEVVGNAGDAAGRSHAFLWTAAGVRDLGTFGGENAAAIGINDSGQVVGSAQDPAARYRAFVWDGTHGMTDLGSPAGYSEPVAYKISPSGLVTGQASDPATGKVIAFLWTPDQPNGVTGTMTTLAPAGANAIPDSSGASDVNDAGVVIGWSYYYVPPDEWSPNYPNGGYYISRATVWKNGVGEDLGVTDANSINAAGQIAGAQVYEDASGYRVGSSAVLLTPVPDPPPSLSIGNVSIVEGHGGTVSAVFTVSLSAASDQTIMVTFASGDGTAMAGSDYQAASDTLTFAPGETSKTITVLVNGDRLGEPNETFIVLLSNPINATIADGSGQGTIIDDEPRVSINDVSKKEGNGNGNSATTVFTFTVTLSVAYDVPLTLSYATADGTAKTSDGDYVASSGTITFAPGETTKTITVVVKGDKKKEANENFFIDLSDLSGYAVFLDSRGTGTILTDD